MSQWFFKTGWVKHQMAALTHTQACLYTIGFTTKFLLVMIRGTLVELNNYKHPCFLNAPLFDGWHERSVLVYPDKTAQRCHGHPIGQLQHLKCCQRPVPLIITHKCWLQIKNKINGTFKKLNPWFSFLNLLERGQSWTKCILRRVVPVIIFHAERLRSQMSYECMSTCACLSQPDLVPSLPSLKQKQGKKQNTQGKFHLVDEGAFHFCQG